MASDASQQESSEQLEHERRLGIFADRLFERLPSDFSENYPIHQRRAIARSAFEFFETRAQPLKLRVYTGERDGRCVVETAMEDRPFIVDSMLEFFHKSELPVWVLLHPVFHVARAADGGHRFVGNATAGERAESLIHAEIRLDSGGHGC